jgi:hypothetical protein
MARDIPGPPAGPAPGEHAGEVRQRADVPPKAGQLPAAVEAPPAPISPSSTSTRCPEGSRGSNSGRSPTSRISRQHTRRGAPLGPVPRAGSKRAARVLQNCQAASPTRHESLGAPQACP